MAKKTRAKPEKHITGKTLYAIVSKETGRTQIICPDCGVPTTEPVCDYDITPDSKYLWFKRPCKVCGNLLMVFTDCSITKVFEVIPSSLKHFKGEVAEDVPAKTTKKEVKKVGKKTKVTHGGLSFILE